MVPALELPRWGRSSTPERNVALIDPGGRSATATAVERAAVIDAPRRGPMLVIDPEATTFVPDGWIATGSDRGAVMLERGETRAHAGF